MRKIRSILFILIGAISIFLGVDLHSMNTGEVETFKEYGGDAYTGIQNTEARTCANVRLPSEIIQEGLDNLFIVAGAFIIALSIPTNKIAKPRL